MLLVSIKSYCTYCTVKTKGQLRISHVMVLGSQRYFKSYIYPVPHVCLGLCMATLCNRLLFQIFSLSVEESEVKP